MRESIFRPIRNISVHELQKESEILIDSHYDRNYKNYEDLYVGWYENETASNNLMRSNFSKLQKGKWLIENWSKYSLINDDFYFNNGKPVYSAVVLFEYYKYKIWGKEKGLKIFGSTYKTYKKKLVEKYSKEMIKNNFNLKQYNKMLGILHLIEVGKFEYHENFHKEMMNDVMVLARIEGLELVTKNIQLTL